MPDDPTASLDPGATVPLVRRPASRSPVGVALHALNLGLRGAAHLAARRAITRTTPA